MRELLPVNSLGQKIPGRIGLVCIGLRGVVQYQHTIRL